MSSQPSPTGFSFPVDAAYARKHNEFFRDARRMQRSAAILAAVLAVIVAVVFATVGVTLWTVALGISLGVFALLCLVVIPVLPKTMGTPQEYYDRYELAPAIVAEVNARDLVIMALVEASAEEGVSHPALSIRTVTSIPGVERTVGTRVPCMAVTGFRPTRGPKIYAEMSPMPVAWGTPDQEVWAKAEKSIPERQWKKLDGLRDRLPEVKKANRDLLVLD